MEDEELSRNIIGCAMRVHATLGPGFLESVYEKALAHELLKNGLKVDCQRSLQVFYDGVVVGDFVADMLVEDRIIIENKSVSNLVTPHEIQLVNYLTATNLEFGILLNFGAPSLEFKRKHRKYRRTNQNTLAKQ